MLTLWEEVEETFDEISEKAAANRELTSVAIKQILKACLKIICERLEQNEGKSC